MFCILLAFLKLNILLNSLIPVLSDLKKVNVYIFCPKKDG